LMRISFHPNISFVWGRSSHSVSWRRSL
jgi:hypothetical protein